MSKAERFSLEFGSACSRNRDVLFVNVSIPDGDGCWTWKGAVNGRGYGRIGSVLVHRAAWSVANDTPVPAGMFVRHRCDNPPCIRPSHLLIGTPADNSRDMVDRRRSLAGEMSPASKLSEDDVRDIVAACAVESQASIAARHGIDRSTVGKIVHGSSWKHIEKPTSIRLVDGRRAPRPGRMAGESNPGHILTEDQVREIFSTPRVLGSGVELARRFGVSEVIVSQIRSGHRWACVTRTALGAVARSAA